MTAADVREIVSLIERERGTAEGFDICIGGIERGDDWDRERHRIRALAEAGTTWWQEWIAPGDVERTRAAIARGPIRID
jgi:hypothetical protein